MGPRISHLFFADDMLLFAVANEGQMKQVLSCLNYLFCEASGQKVSVAKTKILFSKNVPVVVVLLRLIILVSIWEFLYYYIREFPSKLIVHR